MGNLPEPADRARLRVSDADREQAADVLRQAAGDGRITFTELDERIELAYAARTYADLDAVTADLPGPGLSSHPPAAAGAFPADRIGGTAGASFSVAIMSGANRTGGWVVPPRYTALAIMGGVELDLRQARQRASQRLAGRLAPHNDPAHQAEAAHPHPRRPRRARAARPVVEAAHETEAGHVQVDVVADDEADPAHEGERGDGDLGFAEP